MILRSKDLAITARLYARIIVQREYPGMDMKFIHDMLNQAFRDGFNYREQREKGIIKFIEKRKEWQEFQKRKLEESKQLNHG